MAQPPNPRANLVRQRITRWNQFHPQHAIDPQAALAVASREGLSGRIGDSGHAFGDFQLNDAGGVLTGKFPGMNAQQKQAWASSPAGIDYALAGIAKASGGQRGQRAVRSIVSQFERPANIPGEIAGALGALGQFAGGGQVPSLGGAGANVPSTTAPAAAAPPGNPQQLFKALSGTQGGDYGGFYQQLGQTLKRQQAGPVAGTLAPPVKLPKGAPIPVGATGIAKTALTQLGTPYQWGGEAKLGKRTDCSGLLQASARANGISIGRTTYEQYKQGQSVPLKQLQPGDAVFFHPGPRGPEHVAIYIGGGRVVEDPHTGAVVHISQLAGRGAIGARRYG